MKHGIVALVVGTLFGVGLTISGMTQPAKVTGFLDFFGNWDPSLGFVMAGAIFVHFIAYRVKKYKTSPFLADSYAVPTNQKIDSKLILGSALFGVGWGLGGYCPGPAISSLVSAQFEVIAFVAAMTAGMFFHHTVKSKI